MRVTKVKVFKDVRQTISEMRRLATLYKNDIAQYATKPLTEFYDMVKNLAYIPDPTGQETIRRPGYTIRGIGPGRDCDDKAVVMASYAILNNIPWRFVVVSASAKGPYHHVFNEFFLGGKWLPVDATYPWNILFVSRDFPLKKVG